MAIATQRFAYAPPILTIEPTRGSVFKRVLAALKASREAQARREIARHAHLIALLSRRGSEIERNDLPF